MSTTTHAPSFRAAVAPDPSVTAVPFSRLLRVELRKLVDTRAGFWLLTSIGAITAVVVVVFLLAADPDQLTFINFVGATATPQSLLLPVLGILAVTAEWSQRTGLVTFTLEPNRARTAVAKLTAVVLIGAAGRRRRARRRRPGERRRHAVHGRRRHLEHGGRQRPRLLPAAADRARAGFRHRHAAHEHGGRHRPLLRAPDCLERAVHDGQPHSRAWLRGWTSTRPSRPPSSRRRSGATTGLHIAVAGTIWVLIPFALGVVRLLRREVKST